MLHIFNGKHITGKFLNQMIFSNLEEKIYLDNPIRYEVGDFEQQVF